MFTSCSNIDSGSKCENQATKPAQVRKIFATYEGSLSLPLAGPVAFHDQIDRKAVVKRYGALLPIQTLRRRIGLGCELMNSDGSDRCQMTISARTDPREDRP